MDVISLFNGMGTLRQAMVNIGIKVDKYYSSEIKPCAIKLQQHHFPDVIQVGNIKNWRSWEINWRNVGFIGSGSPCQDLSICGSRKGINGDRSSLFFIFVEILNHCRLYNPNVVFLQENVGSADIIDVGIMSRELGLYPVRLNSDKLTAQMRDRYYWTNIRTKQLLFDVVTDIPEPKDNNVMLCDVITSGNVLNDKHICLLEGYYAKNYYKDHKSDKCQKYLLKRSKKSMITLIEDNGFYRLLNKIEMCRLQGFPDNYCDILTNGESASVLGDGWTLPMIEHILSFMK